MTFERWNDGNFFDFEIFFPEDDPEWVSDWFHGYDHCHVVVIERKNFEIEIHIHDDDDFCLEYGYNCKDPKEFDEVLSSILSFYSNLEKYNHFDADYVCTFSNVPYSNLFQRTF